MLGIWEIIICGAGLALMVLVLIALIRLASPKK